MNSLNRHTKFYICYAPCKQMQKRRNLECIKNGECEANGKLIIHNTKVIIIYIVSSIPKYL